MFEGLQQDTRCHKAASWAGPGCQVEPVQSQSLRICSRSSVI